MKKKITNSEIIESLIGEVLLLCERKTQHLVYDKNGKRAWADCGNSVCGYYGRKFLWQYDYVENYFIYSEHIIEKLLKSKQFSAEHQKYRSEFKNGMRSFAKKHFKRPDLAIIMTDQK